MKKLFLIIVFFGLNGCMTAQYAAMKYDAMPASKLCYDYYNGVGGQSAITVPSTSICPLTYSHNISGFTKVCHYPNAFGGPKALTVKSPSICPLTYPR